MWGLGTFLKPYRKFVILAPLFMILEVMFDVLLPKYAAYIINFGVIKRNFHVIEHTGLIMILITFLSFVTGIGCNLFATRASQNVSADIREALYKKIQAFSFKNLDSFKSGSLITRITNDVIQIQNLIQMALQPLVRAPSLLIGSVIMAMIMSLRLGLILLATLVVLVGLFFFLIRLSNPLFSNIQTKLDAVNTKIQDNLSGIRVVKAFVRSHYESKQFRKVNQEYTETSITAARIVAFNSPIVTLIINGCLVIILLYGGNLIWMQSMQVGYLVAFINYVTQVLASLLMVSGRLMNVSQATASAKRIQKVLNTTPEISDDKNLNASSIPAHHIKFHHVNFSFSGTEATHDLLLRDINFEGSQGETIAIIGSTGSGKSALVQLIPRLYEITTGSIALDGKDIRHFPLIELRRNIGMVLQNTFLFTGSVKDNISFGKPGASLEEIIAAAKMAQAHDFITKLPDGYDTKIGQRGVNLSGGQKQRISIARTLLVKPPILIFDDCTSALDLGTEKQLYHSLSEITKESITILIAQRISSIIGADNIIVLDEGRIVGSGTHKELIRSSKVYQEIYESQFGKRGVQYAQ